MLWHCTTRPYPANTKYFIAIVQRWPNIDLGPTVYKCYANVVCLLGICHHYTESGYQVIEHFHFSPISSHEITGRLQLLSPVEYDGHFAILFTHKQYEFRPCTTQQTQNICITFIQHRANVEAVGPTLHNCYINVLCLLGIASTIMAFCDFF